MRPILVVGEMPGSPLGGPPLEGATGARLAELMGLQWADYLRVTERLNLVPSWRLSWPAVDARARAASLARLFPRRRSILLGRRVAEAFGIECLTGVFEAPEGGLVMTLPHPSGRNRWYNSDGNRQTARLLLALMMRADAGVDVMQRNFGVHAVTRAPWMR